MKKNEKKKVKEGNKRDKAEVNKKLKKSSKDKKKEESREKMEIESKKGRVKSWIRNFFNKIRSLKEKIKALTAVAFILENYNKFKTTIFGKIIVRGVNLTILAVALYFLLYPLVPWFMYKFFYEDEEYYPYKTELIETEMNEEKADKPSENRLVIPSISVDMPVVEGNDDSALDLGVWHRPNTGYPGVSNMVVTGHRVGYAFLPENIKTSTSFYNLDKLDLGDNVIVYWNGTEYDYEVYETMVVEPKDTYIEAPTDEHRLTLYTCHPLGKVDKRLVVLAKPV